MKILRFVSGALSPVGSLPFVALAAFGISPPAQAQFPWSGAVSSDPTVAGNYAPAIGIANNGGLWTASPIALNYAPITTTTFGISTGVFNGLSWLGKGTNSTVNVTAGTLNFNGAYPNDGGTETIWIGKGGYHVVNFTINGGYVQVLNGTLIGRDTSTGNLSISNGSFTTGAFNSSVGTYLGAPFGSGAGTGTITLGNAGRFALLGASANPLVFGGNLVASVPNTSSSYVNFTTSSTGSLVLNLSSATLGASYFTNLITNGYVRINGVVNTNVANYSINTSNLSAATLALAGYQAFVHPGLSHTQADLDRMKNNINVEPYKTAYAYFNSQGYSQSANTGQGPMASVTIGAGLGQFEIRNDAQVCHWNAVQWYVTGNTAYRDNAIQLMMGWANTMKSYNQGDILTAGTALLDFCNAGEILRSTSGGGAWPTADIVKFQNWLLTYFYGPCLSPGGSIAANVIGPAGFGGLQIKGLLSMGIFCDRRDIYDFGLTCYQHTGSSSYGLTEYIHSSGQNYETQRDIGHASGNIGSFVESAYMAWNQGLDLFQLNGNLLAKAFELQAKFDLGWDMEPVAWTAADGGLHKKVSRENYTPYDNLTSDLAYRIYHDIKGLEMPYTKLSSDFKFPVCTGTNPSFFHRIDNTGILPTQPLIGQPAPTAVKIYEDYLGGSYDTNLAPGDYNYAALKAAGGTYFAPNATSLKLPIGWTATLYNGDNFTGGSVVVTGTLQNQGIINLIALGFNDQLVSLKILGAAASSYPLFPTTYKLVARHSGKVAQVAGSSTADGANVNQSTYTGDPNQLWRVEDMGNGRFRLLNLNGNNAMEVAGASLVNGGLPTDPGNVDQSTYLTPINVALSGTVTANAGSTPGRAFDGSFSTKWGSAIPAWIQTQLPAAKVVVQYHISSANDVPERDPSDWQFQGSNNGTSWTTLDTRTGQSFSGRFQTNTYTFTNTTSYPYYRLNVTAVIGGPSFITQLSELALYEVPPGDHQRWTITPATGAAYGGYLKILNVNSGKALDVAGASTADGANIIQWTDGGGNNQQWSLQTP